MLSFVVVDDGEKGPGAFGFTCSCAKHLMRIIDKIIINMRVIVRAR